MQKKQDEQYFVYDFPMISYDFHDAHDLVPTMLLMLMREEWPLADADTQIT